MNRAEIKAFAFVKYIWDPLFVHYYKLNRCKIIRSISSFAESNKISGSKIAALSHVKFVTEFYRTVEYGFIALNEYRNRYFQRCVALCKRIKRLISIRETT